MLITAAIPAPKFVQLPPDAIRAAMALGKGHTRTFLELSFYLWGGMVVEGSTSDFCETLGIDVRTWQRHVPELGRSGCLRYSQPQYGYYAFYGYPDDAAAYSRCWDHVQVEATKLNGSGPPKQHELPGIVDVFYLSGNATKLSCSVVVLLSSDSEDLKFLKQKKQQHVVSYRGSGGNDATILSGCDATILSGCDASKLSDDERAAALVLTEAGVSGHVAGTLAMEYTLEGIADVVEAARKAGAGAGWIVTALREEWTVATARRDPRRSVATDVVASWVSAGARS